MRLLSFIRNEYIIQMSRGEVAAHAIMWLVFAAVISALLLR